MDEKNNLSEQIESGLRKTFKPVSADENFILDLGNRLRKRSLVTIEKSKQHFYYIIISLLVVFSGLFIWRLIDKLVLQNDDEEGNQ
jgi:hypothetical protein